MSLIKIDWLLGNKSKLSTSNRISIYKAILKLVRTYGIQLWGTAPFSNLYILECFQSKALRMIVDTLVRAEYGYSNGYPNTNS
jgi:hypothetical protein